jgi:hypothetical protein
MSDIRFDSPIEEIIAHFRPWVKIKDSMAPSYALTVNPDIMERLLDAVGESISLRTQLSAAEQREAYVRRDNEKLVARVHTAEARCAAMVRALKTAREGIVGPTNWRGMMADQNEVKRIILGIIDEALSQLPARSIAIGKVEPALTEEEETCLGELSDRLFDECQQARKARGESKPETMIHDSLSRLRRRHRELSEALLLPLGRGVE